MIKLGVVLKNFTWTSFDKKLSNSDTPRYSNFTVDYSKFVVSNQKEESISIQRVNIKKASCSIKLFFFQLFPLCALKMILVSYLFFICFYLKL